MSTQHESPIETKPERRMDLTVFAQADHLGVMQQAAVRNWIKTLRPVPTHATVTEWRAWVREALAAVVTT